VAVALGWRVFLYRALVLASATPWALYYFSTIHTASVAGQSEGGPDQLMLVRVSLPAIVVLVLLLALVVATVRRWWFLSPLLPLAAAYITWKLLLPALWESTPDLNWYDNIPSVWYFIESVASAAGLAGYATAAKCRRRNGRVAIFGQ
jgi:hypothetical protein